MRGETEVPDVWVLWRRRKGDLDQMLALVKALGWPYVIKRLDFRGPDIPLLAPVSLTKQSDPLTPPWPDLVICAEALPSIMARRLRRLSGGRVKAVCLARPAGTPAAFDLVITTPQYRIPPAGNVLELAMPLRDSAAPGARDPAAANRIAVAVGGASFPDRLDAAAAQLMAAELLGYAGTRNATLDVVTSPRTGADAIGALRAMILPPHRLHVYEAGEPNPYLDRLRQAREIIVTSDSVSMAGDALDTGRPVKVYRLPQTRNMQWHATEWLYEHAVTKPRPWLLPITWAFRTGLFEAPADRHLLFDRLARDGRVAWFGSASPLARPIAASTELALAVSRVKALFGLH